MKYSLRSLSLAVGLGPVALALFLFAWRRAVAPEVRAAADAVGVWTFALNGSVTFFIHRRENDGWILAYVGLNLFALAALAIDLGVP